MSFIPTLDINKTTDGDPLHIALAGPSPTLLITILNGHDKSNNNWDLKENQSIFKNKSQVN